MEIENLINPRYKHPKLIQMLTSTRDIKVEGEIFSIPYELFRTVDAAEKYKKSSINIIILTL